MTIAEERASEYYPELNEQDDVAAWHGFIAGYEQAEKDLAPIVQTAICLYESWQGGTMDEVRRYIVELGHLVQPIRKGGYND